jgi:hypothetical protein
MLGGLAFLIYLLASVVLFGRGVLLSPGDKVVGDVGADKTIYMWSFKWWPHALAHGHDPFDASVVWAPHGLDLSWATSVPIASLLLTPLTATAGPVVTYNVAMLAAPALSAWSAYLLARWLTKSFWPSLVAGWLFGFSAYEIGQMVSHLHLVLTMFVPLCVLLTLRHLHREITNRRFAVLLALALTGQFLSSTEVFITLLIVGAIFVVSFVLFEQEMRSRIWTTLRWCGIALAGCVVLVSPYLWHALVISGTGHAPERSPYSEAADVLNYVVPTRLIWLQLPGSTDVAHRFTAGGVERGAYLGVPLLLIVALLLVGARRSRGLRVAAVGLAATVIASLGASIRVAGHGVLPGPWKVPAALPITRAILPVRLTMYVSLVVAMIAAAWLAERNATRRAWRWALALLAIAFVLPNPATRRWTSAVPNPTFFKEHAHRQHVKEGETVLVLPYGGVGWSLLWQAEDNFAYRLVGGRFGYVPPDEKRWLPVYRALSGRPWAAPVAHEFPRFLDVHGVQLILVAPHPLFHPRRLVQTLGRRPLRVADVVVYRPRGHRSG